jgi:hypothetical protein
MKSAASKLIIKIACLYALFIFFSCSGVKPELPSGVTMYLSSNYASFRIGDRYVIEQNEWNIKYAAEPSYEYIFEGNNGGFFGWKWLWNNKKDGVLSYPMVSCGEWEGHYSAAGFPFPAGERRVISTFDITEDTSPAVVNGRNSYDLAYDIWVEPHFSAKEAKCEIMIWLDSADCMPAALDCRAGSINANGCDFNFYSVPAEYFKTGNWHYAAFQAVKPVLKSAHFDITPFFDYLIEKKIINAKDKVFVIQLGTEVHMGSGTTIISNYSVTVTKR